MKWGILAFVGFMLMSGEADTLIVQLIYSSIGFMVFWVSMKKLSGGKDA